MDTKGIIKEKAREIGFDLVGVTNLSPSVYQEEYMDYLKKGMNADMYYLKKTAGKRLDPQENFQWAKSVVVVGLNYYQGLFPDPREGEVCISRYAMGRDYHYVLSEMLKNLSEFSLSQTKAKRAKYYTDTGPLLEKELAERAGLGWTGKNTLLITERFGSWVFLGELLLDIELEPDPPLIDRCGDCHLCLTTCPNEALISPYRLDSTRCTAYLTVENHGELPDWFPLADNPYIFGCDICQDVCPFNEDIEVTKIDDFIGMDWLINPDIKWLRGIKDEQFEQIFKQTPIGWAGKDVFMRNIKAFLERMH
ncbi:tRNA epoxyqueuosine(34) reductase QueG [candidate division WOR-3 bacterium]|nr:tRNA epoxyqueuosine(34) reductase QueG [candidate division WOR-3 bacterium]